MLDPERERHLAEALADPPQVHAGPQSGSAPKGVWSTDPSCYRFIGEQCHRGCRTLETGLGLSTVLLARWSDSHTCVAPGREEVEELRSYCAERSISLQRVAFVVEASQQALPAMVNDGPLDLVLIDGLHGWPTPIIDWFYAAPRLKSGGVVVVDDTDLPSVNLGLIDFLDRDPRWRFRAGGRKWRSYERTSDGPLAEDWTSQRFLDPALPTVAAREAGKARRRLRLLWTRSGRRK